MNMRVKGQITVFLSLVIMCIVTLICGLLESARTAGARCYLQMAMSSALDSVFSQYHRPLWDSYRLLFAEYDDEEDLKLDFQQYLLPYLETENWYPMRIEDTAVETLYTAVDDNGTYLEQEILDYMKYGVWKTEFEPGDAGKIAAQIREAEAIKEVAGVYRGHTKEAVKLEKALEAISENQDRQKKLHQEGMSALQSYDGSRFRKQAERLIRELRQIPGLVTGYTRQADALAAGLGDSRGYFQDRRESFLGDTGEYLNQEIVQYESYIMEDGARRREIEQLAKQSQEQIRFVESVIEQAEEVEQEIDDWEGDEEEDEPDLGALWSPVIRRFRQFHTETLSFTHGIKDKEKEGWLRQIEQMCSAGILMMVLPEGTTLSQGFMDQTELPSKTELWSAGARSPSLPDHVLINEYCGQFFPAFVSDRTIKEGQMSQLAYQMEYLIAGEDTDEENLTGAIIPLLAVREGLNLIHILSDPQKREEANRLALTISGAIGLTPLVFVMAFFVMSIWALGEAVADIRGMLAGKKIPLLKSREQWTLDMEGLLTMGRQGELLTGGGEEGISYMGWIKLLLLAKDPVCQEYRMMDLMQMNIRVKQKNFRMRNGVYQVGLRSRFCGKHVFFSLGFVDKALGDGSYQYPIEACVERVY